MKISRSITSLPLAARTRLLFQKYHYQYNKNLSLAIQLPVFTQVSREMKKRKGLILVLLILLFARLRHHLLLPPGLFLLWWMLVLLLCRIEKNLLQSLFLHTLCLMMPQVPAPPPRPATVTAPSGRYAYCFWLSYPSLRRPGIALCPLLFENSAKTAEKDPPPNTASRVSIFLGKEEETTQRMLTRVIVEPAYRGRKEAA